MASHSHVLIVGDGDVDGGELVTLARQSAAAERPLVVAADGGAARCRSAGVQPDIVIGDFDSLAPDERVRLEGLGVDVRAVDRDKDESDMELCVMWAQRAGATRVTILGALGVVRPEHSIANLLLLADPRLDGMEVAILGRGSRITRIGRAGEPGQMTIEGEPGDFVSLFPLGAAAVGVTTTGLRFPLQGEGLPLGPSRGLSNELLGARAGVSTQRGCLLVVHTAGHVQQRSEPADPTMGGT
ncbi:MAG TPA: thiamine diphosphokinase [Candidatus Limnocylindrales bacterium]|nr:thiamine diphosphokinase [Candidatus Limnocylindrales bacterium]